MSRVDLDHYIQLNRIAQGYISITSAISWFQRFTESEKRDVLRKLVYMVLQAQARSEDVPTAIAYAELKPTFTPCVQLTHGKLNVQLAKTLQLPPEELTKLFRLLVAMLAIADNRRKEQCGVLCNHWWHGDLGNEAYLESVRFRYNQGEL